MVTAGKNSVANSNLNSVLVILFTVVRRSKSRYTTREHIDGKVKASCTFTVGLRGDVVAKTVF